MRKHRILLMVHKTLVPPEDVAGMSESEIVRTSPPELTDLPDDFWSDAVVVVPTSKRAISLRIDEDVLAWFKSTGPRYQSRMNAVLRSYMSHMRRGRRRGAA